MTNLNRVLQTPGAIVLIQRRIAEGLLVRAYGAAARPLDGGVIRRTLASFGMKASEDGGRPPQPQNLPCAAVRWSESAEERAGYRVAGGLAVIDVKGVLSPDGHYDYDEEAWVGGYEQIGAAVAAAEADPQVKAKLLRLDTPGGLVDGCFDLCDEIRARSARNGGKPTWAAARMAYSAGYAIASACDRIVAPETAGVGSIGVVMLHVEMAKLLDDFGIKVEAIESGAHKTDGGFWKPLDDAARAEIKSEIDGIANVFIRHVSQGRGLSAEQIRGQEARCFLASHADNLRSGVSIGLVDEIGTEAQAAARLRDVVSQIEQYRQ